MLKAIFFDAVGTLIYLQRPVGEHYRKVAADFGLSLDANALDNAFKNAWSDAPLRPSTKDLARAEDDKGWWRDLVDRVLTETLPPEEAASFERTPYFEAVYEHFTLPGVWQVYDDVWFTLNTLRATGTTLGVISNFDRRLYTIFGNLGLREYFSVTIISSEVGAEKPDPTIFQTALNALQVTGPEALHVGDDLEKDGGATKVGMQVFYVERPSRGLHHLLDRLGIRTRQ